MGIIQKIKTILIPETGLDLQPRDVIEAEVSTDFIRTFAHIVGKGTSSGVLLRCTSDGRLYVVSAGTSMEEYSVESGDAEDTYAAADTFEFVEAQYITDFLIESFDATISFRNEAGDYGDDKSIPVGAVSLDLIHYGVRVQNRSPGDVSDYEITTYR